MRHLTKPRVSVAVSLVLACVWCAGCNPPPEKFTFVAVSGTVTCNGEPVNGGTITFSPRAPKYDEITEINEGNREGSSGRSAIASIQNDGTFVLKTSTSDGIEDGAVVSTHRILIDHPVTADFDEDIEDIDELEDEWSGKKVGNPFLELLPCPPPGNLEVDVTREGNNVFNIEMSGGGKVTRVSPEPD